VPGVPAPIADAFDDATGLERSITGVEQPLGVALGRDGTIFATETGGERVVRAFDRNGKPAGVLTPPGIDVAGRVPVYAAVSPAGEVFVSDRAAATIYRYSAEGDFIEALRSPFGDDGWAPLGLAFDRAGNFYVTDVTPGQHRVLVFDASGRLTRQFGTEGEGDGQFEYPNAVATDAAGRIYVADSNNGRVQIFDANGVLQGRIGRGAAKGSLAMPRGLAIDDERQLLFVVDITEQQVAMYDISTGIPAYVDSFGESAGLKFPNAIALDGRGHAYVTDRENNRITEWRY
jgi:sugar lactone lactonase YvrE